MSRGFLVIAQNSVTGDYIRCAAALANSLRVTQRGPSGLSVLVPKGQKVPKGVFEHVIEFDSLGTDENRWNAHTKYHAMMKSPYEETILMDADMLVPCDISSWWDLLADRDVLFSCYARTFRGELIDEDINPFRKEFRDNNLPHVYTALMYFKTQSSLANEVAQEAKLITENWELYRKTVLPEPVSSIPTDDMTFACVARNFGGLVEPDYTWFSFIHMKTRLQGITYPDLRNDELFENWEVYLNSWINPDGSVVIGNHLQMAPLHYHLKEFVKGFSY